MANAYDTYKLLSENPEFVEELQKLIIDDNKNESLTEDTVKTSDGMGDVFNQILDGFEEFASITHNERAKNKIDMYRNLFVKIQ